MRYLKNIFIILLGGVIMASCSKEFLTLNPEGNLNEGIFFKSTQDFEQALIGAYVPLRTVASQAFYMDECRSDNAMYFYFARDRGNFVTENLVDFLDQSDNPTIANRWNADYVGIFRCNSILDRIEKIKFDMAQADKDRIVGETKALRAHYYFDLVVNYGGVPLFVHEVTKRDDAFLGRSSVEQVYAQIISDLKDAIGALKNPTFSGSDIGRVNKGSASTELGRVYLQLGDFANAMAALEPVTQMGYQLLPNFRDVLNPANKGNHELIFDIQYQSGNTSQQSDFIYRFIPITPDTKDMLGVSFNNTIGGWDVPTDDLMSVFEPGDSRYDASIGVMEGTTDQNDNFILDPNGIKSIVGYSQPTGKAIRYFARKYFYPPYPNLNRNTDQNWPLYRYSDVLLMLAECYNEAGSGRDANKSLGYLNQVRQRAFGSGNGMITTTSQTDLRDVIAKERRRELAFENKRWQDLIRTGQAISVMNAYGVDLKAKYSYLLPNSYNVTQNRLLYAIPFEEVQRNKNLTQNPGY